MLACWVALVHSEEELPVRKHRRQVGAEASSVSLQASRAGKPPAVWYRFPGGSCHPRIPPGFAGQGRAPGELPALSSAGQTGTRIRMGERDRPQQQQTAEGDNIFNNSSCLQRAGAVAIPQHVSEPQLHNTLCLKQIFHL